MQSAVGHPAKNAKVNTWAVMSVLSVNTAYSANKHLVFSDRCLWWLSGETDHCKLSLGSLKAFLL